MANAQPITDYTNRDYTSLLASLLDLAALKMPEWTDRSENDVGRLLLELFAYTGDLVFYYQDRIANESFLSTAVERRSVIDLLALIGYTLATPAAAAAVLTVQGQNDDPSPLRIEVGATFATQAAPGKPAVEFIYLPPTGVALEIPRDGKGGPLPAFTITVQNASLFTGEVVGISTGEQNQSFQLSQRPLLIPRDPDDQGQLRVYVDTGGGPELWQKRGTLLYSRAVDPHFMVETDDNDGSSLVFGDGLYGRVPPAGSTISASYLVGGGAAGNVGAGTITVVKSGVSATIAVTNAAAASGGADRESIANAKQQAPQVFRSFQRAVTAGDYAALARNVPGVARAVAVSVGWNYVDLYVVADGGLDPEAPLLDAVSNYFDTRRMITTVVSPRTPVFVAVDLQVSVEVLPSYFRADVQRRVENALAALFALDGLDFGQAFYLSRIYEAVQGVEGVSFAQVSTFQGTRSTGDVVAIDPSSPGVLQLRALEFPRAGTIKVTATKGLA